MLSRRPWERRFAPSSPAPPTPAPAARSRTSTLDALPAGEVTIAVEYSSLNYKDALAATGQNKVAASYPHVPGIDAAGTVAESTDPAWTPGDRVLVTGYDFGAPRWGGWARYARVPSAWVVRIPDALSTFEAMAIGTAGFTAALGLEALARNGTTPESGPIVVTGATGGVGCLAVDLFAGAGYRVVAVTGKADRHDWLRTLGAAEILPREAVSLAERRRSRGRCCRRAGPARSTTSAAPRSRGWSAARRSAATSRCAAWSAAPTTAAR